MRKASASGKLGDFPDGSFFSPHECGKTDKATMTGMVFFHKKDDFGSFTTSMLRINTYAVYCCFMKS